MKKEYRGKFGNFVHEERKKEEETLEICEDILKNSRNEMAVAMRFLQSAFGALRPTVSGETDVMGTDGKLLFASPTWLLNTFIQNKVWINRMYLHELLHCLFCHLWNRKVKEESDQRLWNPAADMSWMTFMRKRSISDRTVSEEKSTASGRKKRTFLQPMRCFIC